MMNFYLIFPSYSKLDCVYAFETSLISVEKRFNEADDFT